MLPLKCVQQRLKRCGAEFCKVNWRNFSDAEKSVETPRTFSGIQPTGTLHLGNYLGAVKRWGEELTVENRANKIFCVVDLHAITLPQDPKCLRTGIREMTASLLACGLDPKRCILFQQSSVQEHAELGWILGTLCTMPRLAQLTQYKDKSERLPEVLLGLYLYPVLQSADILLYKATRIPVGEDNLQNIQIAQHLCQKFNSTFGNYFPRPQAVLPDNNTARLRSLRNPEKKMSKSDLDQKSCIFINDPPDLIREKIKKSVTDTTKEITYDPENRPGIANLILIYSSLTNQSPESAATYLIENNFNKVKLKEEVTDVLIEHLNPIRTEMTRLLDEGTYLDAVLAEGRDAAREIAVQTIRDVKQRVGFI